MTTEARVIEIIAGHLGIDASTITLDSSLLDDLGADSLDAVEIVMTLEEEYDIEIPETAAEDFTSVANIVTYITDNAF